MNLKVRNIYLNTLFNYQSHAKLHNVSGPELYLHSMCINSIVCLHVCTVHQ